MLQTIVTLGWRRLTQAALGLGMATLLSACGGGGGSAGDSVFPGPGNGGTTPTTLAALAVAGNATLPNTGSDTLTLTVTALTTGNTALIGATTPVDFSVSSGAIVTPSAKTTNATDGKLTAVVSLVDKTSREITVTASSGSISQTFKFNVVDSVTGSKVADISLVADKTTLPNNGTQTVTITATTVDAKGTAAGGAPLTFEIVDAVTGKAVVTPDGLATTTSTASGQLKATVTLGSNHSNRTITVNATSGTVTRSVSFDVIDSSSVNPVASDLTISLDKATVGNSGSDVVAVTATAVDSSRNAVKDIDVTFSVDQNAVLVVGNGKTDANGVAKASVTIGADRSNRLVTVTAKSGTFMRQASFRVTGAKLQATLQPATLKVGDTGQVQYTLSDVNGNPMVGAAVTVTGPGASTVATCPGVAAGAPQITDGNGRYLYCYVAAGSGPTTITASAGGGSLTSTVQIDAKLSDVPASTTIASATFTVAPSVVNVNAVGSKDNRAELRLLFLTDKNVPVPNVRVRLGLGTNASGTDGDISSGKDVVITSDTGGVAVSSFVPGQRGSATDQVMVYACYGKDDTVETIAACPASRLLSVSLTVVEQPLSISIGTDNAVGEGANGLTYTQKFTVLVVNAAGQPQSDVQLTPVLDLPSYSKGFWFWDAIEKTWVQNVTISCLNEDSSPNGFRNGTIETSGGVSEDLNGSGQLDPRKSDVSIAMVGTTKTNAAGTAVMQIEYPKSYGKWTEYSIRVSASGVVSPPAWYGRLATATSTLATLVGNKQMIGVPIDIVKAEAEPPFVNSPYGKTGSCSSPN
ncbi:MAG TPA: Ig-like domain-containing protein [Roseateles sp.]